MIKYFIQLILEIILASFLFFNVFVSNNMNNGLVLVCLIIFLMLSIAIYKFRRPTFRGKKEVIFSVFGLCMILLIGTYLFGFATGFNKNYSVIYKNYITFGAWSSVFAILFITEIIRYVISQVNTRGEKKYWITNIIMLIIYVLIDLSVATKTYDLTNFNQLYEFFALVLVQSLSKNILLMYVSKKYGYEPCLVYRLIMDLYIYIIPVTPKINVFIEGVIYLVFPYIVYWMISSINTNEKLGPARKEKKKDGILTFITAMVFAVLVMLVSREFSYCMIAIGSGSMTGTINKGDAIIYKTYNEDEDELKVGDILVFRKNNMIIVHRIENKISMGDEYVYQTKGDANKTTDNWLVKTEDVVGVVKLRVLWIAWPSVLLNELF